MKKIYKSLSVMAFVAAGGSALAQAPTLSSIVVPQVGYTYTAAADTTPADMPSFTVTAGSASAQTWNYTSQFATVYADVTAFVAPGSNPGASNFPSSNLAFAINSTDWAYMVGNSSGLFVDGAYVTIQGSPAAVDYNPNPTQIPVPFTYGSTPVVNTYTATFNVTVSGIPATVNHRGTRTITADAFGSLTTPTATYPNTLRVKIHEVTSDSIYAFGMFQTAQYDSTDNYTWVQNTVNAQVMEIDLDKTGACTKASYQQSFSNGVATINAPSAGLSLYPNPASDVTYFTYENKTTGMVNIQLMDVTGKQVAVIVNEQQAIGKQNVAINLAALHLPKGMYFVQLNSNNVLQTKKLTIQ
ncbi:MAG: T9SS type A sorting domain-containing protein [Bacteroidia bacterium]